MKSNQNGLRSGSLWRPSGSALGLAIVMALLIGIISGYFVLQAHLNKMVLLHYERNERVMRNCQSGLEFLLSSQQEVALNDDLVRDLFGAGQDSVYLKRKAWGVYEIIHAKGINRDRSFGRSALVGASLSRGEERHALYLCDYDRPLAVCGHTRLEGICYLPSSGVKRAYIEGSSYQGDKLVFGEKRVSTRELPAIRSELKDYLIRLAQGVFTSEDSIVSVSELPDTLHHSYEGSTLVVQSSQMVHLTEQVWSGNIIVYSADRILVEPDCSLSGLILVAPEVEIRDGFQGKIQVVSSRNLKIGKDVTLNYPSALAIVSLLPGDEQLALLNVGERSRVSGCIMGFNAREDIRSLALVSLDSGSQLDGDLYVAGTLDLKGTVDGSVWCRKITLRTRSGTYENHLLDATIRGVLPQYFLRPELFGKGNREVIEYYSDFSEIAQESEESATY